MIVGWFINLPEKTLISSHSLIIPWCSMKNLSLFRRNLEVIFWYSAILTFHSTFFNNFPLPTFPDIVRKTMVRIPKCNGGECNKSNKNNSLDYSFQTLLMNHLFLSDNKRLNSFKHDRQVGHFGHYFRLCFGALILLTFSFLSNYIFTHLKINFHQFQSDISSTFLTTPMHLIPTWSQCAP